MDKLLESKESMIQTINGIIHDFSSSVQIQNETMKNIQKDNDQLHKLVHKMTCEIQEKDKLLSMNEKTIHEYSVLINKLQETKEKELNDKEKHNMLRIQDKEIKRLTDEINFLKRKNTQSNKEKESQTETKEYITGFSPTSSSNIIDESEFNITTLNLDEGNNSEVKEVVQEVVQEVTPHPKKKVEKPIVEEPTVEEPIVEEKVEKPTVEEPIVEEKVEEEVEKPTVEEEVEKPTVEEKVEKPTVEEEVEESIEVEVITHYKKEYFIITGETPQYIYAIDNDDLGDRVGEIQGKKKVFYDSPKK